jgi:hypothetical protein
MSSGKGTAYRRVIDYYMTMHYGFCWGPVDAILEIKIKDLVAWSGEMTASGTLALDLPQLFGGDEKEGGVKGYVDVLFGDDTQVMSDGNASRFSLTSATMPGFRGVLSMFFRGAANDEGFMWCQNNPYLPGVSILARRTAKGLPTPTALITRTSEAGVTTRGANPIHMIYECYTNSDWGLGWSSALFKPDEWEDVAQVIYDEGFGLAMIWVDQMAVEDFVAEIQDHIQAVIREDPTTGLLGIKLVRGDYNLDDCYEFNPSNCVLVNPERRALENTTNEIIVSYTDPDSEEDATITVQDLGNISAQGTVISETRNYYGIRNPDLALDVAARDLASASYPTFSCQIRTDRRGRNIMPGDVIRLVWPELGIDRMACRVIDADRGVYSDGAVVLSVIEDIFGLDQALFSKPVTSLWEEVSDEPEPITVSAFMTLPYPTMMQRGITVPAYPSVRVGVLARQDVSAAYKFTLSTEKVLPDLSTSYADQTGRLFTPIASTTVGMAVEATTVMSDADMGTFRGDPALTSGDLLYITGADDASSEVVMLVSYDAGEWTIARGCYDTVPQEWSVGALLWYARGATAFDGFARTAGAAQSYWIRPVTLAGTLAIEDAAEEVFTPSERPHLPFRPSNLRVNGNVGFGSYTYTDFPSTINVVWSNRNRTLEDSVTNEWLDASVTPETGQTTTLKLYNDVGAFLTEITGLTGTSYGITTVGIPGFSGEVEIRAFAVRDGLESLCYSSRLVIVPWLEETEGGDTVLSEDGFALELE